MKKLLLSILAILYITSSSGAVVHLHYCMNQFIGWAVWHNDSGKKECSNCGMDKTNQNKGCCKDEHKLVKVNNEQKTNNSSFKLYQPVKFILSFYTVTELPLISFSFGEKNLQTNAPPLTALEDTFLLNCNFRI